MRRGFTLIELLVAIGVIGILLALLIPGLAGSREEARTTVCLAHLRGAAACFDAYSRTYRDAFPFVKADAPLRVTPPDEDGGMIEFDDPWKLMAYWPATMHDVAPWREFYGSWICPGSSRAPGRPWEQPGLTMGVPSYGYSRSFLARPELWSPGAKADPMFLRPVLLSDVESPSRKALLYDVEMAHASGPDGRGKDARPVLFVDGHAARKSLSDASIPVTNPFTGDALPLHDTARGARGFDY